MSPKRIFLTGASGCIGHYLAEALITETEHELFLLVRNPDKLGFDYEARPGVTILQADLREIERFSDFLKTIDVAILAATAWGGTKEVLDINVIKTIRLMNLLDPEVCEQVIYFSTASILDRNHKLLAQANQVGTDYIRSKYDCFSRFPRLVIASQITVLFPTLVFGGDANKPYSHISSGVPDVAKWIDLIRWFKADGSFHFIHARDIAMVVRHLVDRPPAHNLQLETEAMAEDRLVLGNRRVSVNEAVEMTCAYLDKKIYFRLSLPLWLANFFIAVFKIQMSAWDRFSLNYRHFTYQNPVNPATFGLPIYCATLSDVLKLSGISRGSKVIQQEE